MLPQAAYTQQVTDVFLNIFVPKEHRNYLQGENVVACNFG